MSSWHDVGLAGVVRLAVEIGAAVTVHHAPAVNRAARGRHAKVRLLIAAFPRAALVVGRASGSRLPADDAGVERPTHDGNAIRVPRGWLAAIAGGHAFFTGRLAARHAAAHAGRSVDEVLRAALRARAAGGHAAVERAERRIGRLDAAEIVVEE